MDPVARLLEQGQSLWLDYIDRRALAYGTLQRLVDAGIRGVTTNPTIFHKAIGEDGAYEALIQRLLGDDHGMATETLCEQLMIGDVQAALGIGLSGISTELEADGVRKFAESRARLNDLLNDKRCAVGKGRAAI
jgi:transaldolase